MEVLFIKHFQLQVQEPMLQVQFLPPWLFRDYHSRVNITHEYIAFDKAIEGLFQGASDSPLVEGRLVNYV